MKATILNGATGDDVLTRRATDTLTGLLQAGGCEVEQIRLEELDIAPCLGCFGCWVKTPGVCVIDDAGRDLAKKAIQCDLLTFVTPITFGGYSYQLKKAADRLIPLILPYFQLVGGEVHHQKRYAQYPVLLGLGTLPGPNEAQEQLFRTLVRRNAINFRNPNHAATVVRTQHEDRAVDGELKAVLGQLKVIQ